VRHKVISQAGERFGYRIATIGNLNNDGIMDMAVGTPFGNVGGTNRGSVYIIFLTISCNSIFSSILGLFIKYLLMIAA